MASFLFGSRRYWALLALTCLAFNAWYGLRWYKLRMQHADNGQHGIIRFSQQDETEYATATEIVDNPTFISEYVSILSNTSDAKLGRVGIQKKPLPLDYQTHLAIVALYKRTLAAVPRQYFGLSNNVFIGAPFSTLLAKSTARVKSGPITENPPSKRILLWTPFYENVNWVTSQQFQKCNVRCAVSTNKSDLMRSDAVVIHTPDLRKMSKLPSWRHPQQRYVYYLDEGPQLNGMVSQAEMNGVFNWTMTVREDSDFLTRYIETRKRPKSLSEAQFQKHFNRIIRKKTKLVSAMISNCYSTATDRLAYVRQLSQYIDVDFYGGCGNLKTECPRVYRRGEFQCTKTIHSRYKFYLAFENSNCRNYVTEKSKLPLLYWNAVPVVMGGVNPEDYERILPPNSYIHTSGFNSAKDLAHYLHILDRNVSLYESYFQWHRTHRVMPDGPQQWCELCEALHDNSSPIKVYSDFLGWFNENSRRCRMTV